LTNKNSFLKFNKSLIIGIFAMIIGLISANLTSPILHSAKVIAPVFSKISKCGKHSCHRMLIQQELKCFQFYHHKGSLSLMENQRKSNLGEYLLPALINHQRFASNLFGHKPEYDKKNEIEETLSDGDFIVGQACQLKEMSEEAAKTELDRISQQLAEHDRRYYEQQDPTISDAQYDALVLQALAIEEKFPHLVQSNSRSQRVGFSPLVQSSFLPASHATPMLSLDNAFTLEEVSDWLSRAQQRIASGYGDVQPAKTDNANQEAGETPQHPEIELYAEPKIDGLSVSLLYEDGILVRGATRGDGLTGEDLTENVRQVSGIPHSISGDCPKKVEVRGEIYISLSNFMRLNTERAAANESAFANPRNIASGSLRNLDPAVTRDRKLDFFAYSMNPVFEDQDKYDLPSTQSTLLQQLKMWGFAIPQVTQKCTNINEVMSFYEYLEKERSNLDYEIDGMVLKVNNLDLHQILGATARAPRWALAYKFSAETAVTQVESIVVQVGRTGALTPVANLQPVMVGRVAIGRATLHNFQELARKDVRPGDQVVVRRAGDVIPEVVEVVRDDHAGQNTGRNAPFEVPTHCPACGTPVVRAENASALRCPAGLQCPAQAVESLYHFCSRGAMDISGLGRKRVVQLVNLGLLSSPNDIFTLERRNLKAQAANQSTLQDAEGWGKLSVNNLFKEIDKVASDGVSLGQFIYALGIPLVGKEMAERISEEFGSFDDWWEAMQNVSSADNASNAKAQFEIIPGVGENLLRSLSNCL